MSSAIGLEPVSQETLLQDLGSHQFIKRQQASQYLLTAADIGVDQFTDWYAHAWLPEQRHRLLAACRHHVIRQLRLEHFANQGEGSIGISHRTIPKEQLPDLDQPAVCVMHTFPGFPGYAYLQPGDLIVAVDDQPLPANTQPRALQNKFLQMVRNHPAGQTARFTVQRHGQTIHLAFTLSSAAALKGMFDSDGEGLKPVYQDQWLAVRGKLLALAPPPDPLRIGEANANEDQAPFEEASHDTELP